ncbi:hypothetical protein F4810DRAFT_643884 [Camillea tinctor]|nr:hypothetical protein F4810DRAFT_643884 [Camillea tinctor]
MYCFGLFWYSSALDLVSLSLCLMIHSSFLSSAWQIGIPLLYLPPFTLDHYSCRNDRTRLSKQEGTPLCASSSSWWSGTMDVYTYIAYKTSIIVF